jgi:two-component sensor histidine kinase
MVGSRIQIQFEGPDVELLGILARPMCMAIHELATNAMKHGALGVDSGTVMISTTLLPDNHLQLSWLETDGPTVPEERTTSTGISLLEGLVSHEMHGTIELNFKESGLHCTIEVPLKDQQ